VLTTGDLTRAADSRRSRVFSRSAARGSRLCGPGAEHRVDDATGSWPSIRSLVSIERRRHRTCQTEKVIVFLDKKAWGRDLKAGPGIRTRCCRPYPVDR